MRLRLVVKSASLLDEVEVTAGSSRPSSAEEGEGKTKSKGGDEERVLQDLQGLG